uniref:Monodehydroascorbate reductase n=1 Tax=Tanacetum cinerariifolium TaxID=118510 RepID=A0A6L2J9E7_TANCI|nr:hypothetical protein [Tanacetum cinerariifolium]
METVAVDSGVVRWRYDGAAVVRVVTVERVMRSNFYPLSDIKSKESTLQLVYDVLRITPFFKAFLVTADVPEIYMQEFWATTTVHHHAIRFKMDNQKHIINLESFRDMLQICPRFPSQSFVEPPFKEEILAFICFLRHSAAIMKLIDVNINKLYQPWRSFAAIINKCLTGKSSGYDSLRLSQAQMLWGLYHKRNVDYAYLMWEDFVYQVEHKDSKKSNEMYYPRFTKVIIYNFMSKDPSIPRRNKVNWHYVKDDHMFSTIKLPKASVRKTRSSSDTTITPPTTAAGDDDDHEVEKDDEEEGGDDEQEYDEEEYDEETRDEKSFDPIPKTPKNSDDEGNGEEDIGLNVGREEGHDEKEEEDELYKDVNINQGRGIQTTLEVEDSHVTLTLVNLDGQQQSSSVSSQFMTSMLNPTLDVAQKENDEFLKTIDENIQKIIKEQVKEQVKVQVSKILQKIEQTVNEQLEAEVLTQSSHSSKTSYALVEAYKSDKIILDTYGETTTLKRSHDDDADKDEEPFAEPDRGSKRCREEKEPESASALKEKVTRSAGKSTQGTKSRQASASESAIAEEPIDDDKLYKFKEGDFKRLRIQYIEDMLLLLVQGKLTNLTVEELFAFNVSLQMFTRSIVIQRRVEDLQLGVKSYLKKHNLTKPDTDVTLTDVRTALDDHLKGIRIKYLP